MTADAATSPVKKVRRFIRRALCERADHHLGVALVNSECFETGFEEGLHLGVFDIRDESFLDQPAERLFFSQLDAVGRMRERNAGPARSARGQGTRVQV